jgi:hypothetical protein
MLFGFPNAPVELNFDLFREDRGNARAYTSAAQIMEPERPWQSERAFDAASTQTLRWAQSGRFSRMFLLAEITQRLDGHEG